MKTTRKQHVNGPILEVESEDTNQGIALAFEPDNLISSPEDPPKKEDGEGQGQGQGEGEGEDESGKGGGSENSSGGGLNDGRPIPDVGVGTWSLRN
jgi:hypothetical protein